MDQSASELQTTLAYGGSDRVAPSFNRMQYVRFGSIHEPKSLGQLSQADLLVRGEVGAESGSQTLFFHFGLSETARLGIQPLDTNPRLSQYLQYKLRRVDDAWLDLNEYGITTWSEGSSEVISATIDTVQSPTTPTAARYVDLDPDTGQLYWAPGGGELGYYALGDDGAEPTSGVTQIVSVIREQIEVAYPTATAVDPGEFVLTVSGSQWPQIPFLFRLIVRPAAALAGEATVDLAPTARLSLVQVGGEATVDVDTEGRPAQTFRLGGEAAVDLKPRLAVQVTSPFS